MGRTERQPASPQSVATTLRGPPDRGARTGRSPARCQRQPAVAHGERERRAQQRRLHVGRHVVGPLERVRPLGAPGHGGVEPGSKSRRTSGRGVLVQRQRGGGVEDQQVEEPDPDITQIGRHRPAPRGDEVEAARARRQVESGLFPSVWRDRQVTPILLKEGISGRHACLARSRLRP